MHPGFNTEDKKLQGIWVAKYKATNVNDIIAGTAPTGASTLPYASDTAGNNHTHTGMGAGTKERFVTNSTRWCSGKVVEYSGGSVLLREKISTLGNYFDSSHIYEYKGDQDKEWFRPVIWN